MQLQVVNRTALQIRSVADLAGGTFLAEADVELVVEQGLVVGADIDRDRQALQQSNHFPSSEKRKKEHSKSIPILSYYQQSSSTSLLGVITLKKRHCEQRLQLRGEHLRGQCRGRACQREFPSPGNRDPRGQGCARRR